MWRVRSRLATLAVLAGRAVPRRTCLGCASKSLSSSVRLRSCDGLTPTPPAWRHGATRCNATPILPSPDLARLKGKLETLEKDLCDTRKQLNHFKTKCNDLEARCKAQDGKLEDLRDRVQVLNHTDQVRDKEMAHTQRDHSKVTKKVTEIESCLAKANAEKKRLRTNVKESKMAAAAAALQARLDVERQDHS